MKILESPMNIEYPFDTGVCPIIWKAKEDGYFCLLGKLTYVQKGDKYNLLTGERA